MIYFVQNFVAKTIDLLEYKQNLKFLLKPYFK